MTARIEIRFAKLSDETRIIRFLDDHWRRNHIFVTNPEVMRWQYQSPSAPEDELNLVLAERLSSSSEPELVGLLGYIPFRRFDVGADWSEVALAVWKVRDDAGAPGLGLQLLKALQRVLSPRMICAIGISQIVKPIYKALGYQIGVLSHAALFPKDRAGKSVIAKNVPESAYRRLDSDPSISLEAVTVERLPGELFPERIDAICENALPRKSWTYIVNRYLKHPWYKYQIRAIYADGDLEAIVIWRCVEVPQIHAKVLRIVDIIGDPKIIARCGSALREEVLAAECEYIDLLHFGVSAGDLESAGFVSINDYPDMVLPNYFEPFEQVNVRVELAYRVDPAFLDRRVCLFRADSDQDRPNLPQALIGQEA